MDNKEMTFPERAMKETNQTVGDAASAATHPFEVFYERISPLVKEMLFRKVVRPLLAPKRIRPV
jgi:hypothetical protein